MQTNVFSRTNITLHLHPELICNHRFSLDLTFISIFAIELLTAELELGIGDTIRPECNEFGRIGLNVTTIRWSTTKSIRWSHYLLFQDYECHSCIDVDRAIDCSSK